MPISATGTSASRPPGPARQFGPGLRAGAGFTLIELIVVVAIIALVSAAIVVSVSLTGRDRELEKESERLYTLMNYVREQAELQTREYGVLFQDDRYEFLTYDPRRGIWRSIPEEEDWLTERKLPAGLSLTLRVDARPVVLTAITKTTEKKPQVMIMSNGDLSSFSATLERDGGLRSVTVTENDQGQLVKQPMVETKQQP